MNFKKVIQELPKLMQDAYFINKIVKQLISAAAQYGVPAENNCSYFWELKLIYGKNVGNIRTADSLATLAFDYPRRGAFFSKRIG